MKVTYMKQKTFLGLSAILTLVLGCIFLAPSAHAATVDLREYYPNQQLLDNYYLEGTNTRNPSTPVRNVLWFGKVDSDGTVFKQYNYGPEDPQKDCHWDLLSWANDKLTYQQTHDGCDGNNKNVTFGTPMQFLPRYWDDTAGWTMSGTTSMTTTKFDGSTGCTGTNAWVSTILGRETVSPGVEAIHWRTVQTINWDTGSDSPNCVAGGHLYWQEDLYLTNNIKVNDYKGLASAPGLLRTFGGNTEAFTGSGMYDWDIKMDHWALLPWATAQEIPGVPDTGNAASSRRFTAYFVAIAATLAATTLVVRKRARR